MSEPLRDKVIPALPAGEIQQFRAWLESCHYEILETRGSWELLRFTNGIVTCSLERRAKKNSLISFNGAAEVLEYFRKETVRKNHPAIATIQVQRFCKDCIHHSWEQDEAKFKHFCTARQLLNLVTGQRTDALSNRKNESLCGQSARYFKAKAGGAA